MTKPKRCADITFCEHNAGFLCWEHILEELFCV